MNGRIPIKGEALTERQTETLKWLCEGLIAKEIAGKIGVSQRTVETHIQLAKWKLGARNIVQAAVMFTLGNKPSD